MSIKAHDDELALGAVCEPTIRRHTELLRDLVMRGVAEESRALVSHSMIPK